MEALLKLVDAPAGSPDIDVTVSSTTRANGGRLAFADTLTHRGQPSSSGTCMWRVHRMRSAWRTWIPPWHRAYLLDFERALQGIDAEVSLPYWRFDQASPNVFN
ncbi:hypothetical protein AJ87_08815 [Rhizobium yanglingense]|nr:hypothetical protein AJ87_08815 [Rhizobium yanglingense]